MRCRGEDGCAPEERGERGDESSVDGVARWGTKINTAPAENQALPQDGRCKRRVSTVNLHGVTPRPADVQGDVDCGDGHSCGEGDANGETPLLQLAAAAAAAATASCRRL